ncbi:hypothetical protein CMQ_2519 [Grosmannia clavigera kw1407]|uniref:Uncharacterized protein n=1 Tax=Grosmannia clavigera (strain kw1407 / UAMH 11150) TaxID=655863 RepID=F0XGT5_GROCL|nr:uncharacterized protein CMQ_2519 [Grosmannia clavigera kw1407]EFX02590.1 hypothetical protein CMQ_2519 [Grosmannia clavigera kw1407]
MPLRLGRSTSASVVFIMSQNPFADKERTEKIATAEVCTGETQSLCPGHIGNGRNSIIKGVQESIRKAP